MRALKAGLVLAAIVLTSATHAGPYTETGHDPATMLAWATDVDEIVRGPMDIASPGGGNASFGAPEDALGPSTPDPFDVVSLGDGGSITLYFDSGIEDGSGDDFAVFENAFFSVGGLFAEFAFVEVSSDGVDFARFDSTSLQDEVVPGGAVVDPTDYHNLGGDQAQPLGTGFDLAGLADDPLVIAGSVDLDDIAYVRLVDVIGDGSTLDGQGLPLYDPYPTPFSSGGFDLEAVGVIHPVPEPGSVAMLVAGAVLLGGLQRRRGASSCARIA
jgi:hypothetical protein